MAKWPSADMTKHLERQMSWRRPASVLLSAALSFSPVTGLPLGHFATGPLGYPVAWAAIPWMLNYQGRLTDTTDKALQGTFTFTFRLYDAADSGAEKWRERQALTLNQSDNGVFSAVLGAVTALSSVDFNTPLWLSVQVDDDVEMTPRQRLTATGYAVNADQVDSLDSSSFMRTDVDTATSGKLTITRSGVALLIKPTTDPAANTTLVDVQNAAGSSKFNVDLEGDTVVGGSLTVAGNLSVTGTISGSTSTTGSTSTSWTVGSGTDATASNISLLFGQSSGQESLVFQGASTDDFVFSDDVRLDAQSALKLMEASANGTDFVALKAPSSIASSVTWTLPSADGSANQALISNGSGTLSWATVSSLSGVGDVSDVGDCSSGACFSSGGSGTALTLRNATSGTVTLQTVSGALGTKTISLPATTGTLITTGDTGTVTGTMIADGASGVSLTTDVTGTLPVANGGTGATSLTANGVLYGGGTSAMGATSVGASNTVLHGNTGAAPSFSAVSLTADVTGALPIANGGTNGTTTTAAFNNLSPLTTLGDVLYHDGTNNVRLAGNSTSTKKFLSQTGTGSASAAPAWNALSASDVASGTLGVANGGTGADLSATGGSNQVVKQTSSGGAFTVGALTDADVPDNLTLATTTAATVTKAGIGTTSTDALSLINSTAAAAGAQQYSPRLRLTGQGWKTNAAAASQTVDWLLQTVPVQGAANPTSYLDFSAQVNAGGYTNLLALTSGGSLGLGVTSPSYLLSLDGTAARTIGMERHTTSNTAGNNLTLLAGGATSGATDKSGGTLTLSGGTATGTGSSSILLQTAKAGSTGTTDNAPATKLTLDGTSVAYSPHGTSAGNTLEEHFLELAANGTNYVGLKASDSIAANVIWTLPTADGSSGQVLTTNGSGALSWAADASGTGTVTSVSVTTANGVSGSVATATTTPAITLTLGAITPTTVNKVTLTAPATGSTLTIANGKTLTASNSLTLAGTDSTTMTFPGSSDTVVTLAATQTLSNKTLTTPKFADGGYIADANGNEELILTTTASAVNELTLANAATGNRPTLTASGGDTNVGIGLTTKGSGSVYITGDATIDSASYVQNPAVGGLFLAQDPTASNSDGYLFLGRNSAKTGGWNRLNSSGSKLQWNGSELEVEGDSPASMTFGNSTNKVSLTYDPSTDAIWFSKGIFTQQFRNLVQNGSFEAFSAIETFVGGAVTGGTGGAGAAFQGGWQNFAPDGWLWEAGKVYQHAPNLFTPGTTIDANTLKNDFYHGKSAVTLEDTATGLTDGPYNAAKDATASYSGVNDAHIEQTVSGLKPSTVYAVGAYMRRLSASAEAMVDVTGEETSPATTLGAALASDDNKMTIQAAAFASFPNNGILIVESERISYTGKESPNILTSLIRGFDGTTAAAHANGAAVTFAPFKHLTTSGSATPTVYTLYKAQFVTTPKADDIKLHLICFGTTSGDQCRFDGVQVVEGRSVPEFQPSSLVDTGDQTLYGSLRMGRTSDGRGGILAVDKALRTRAIEFFEKDPGISGTTGGFGGIAQPVRVAGSSSITPTTSGTYFNNIPREYRITGVTSTTFKVDYRDCPTMPCAGSFAQLGSNQTIVSGGAYHTTATEIPLSFGVKLSFSAASGLTTSDQWTFMVTGMNLAAQYNSYSGTASYQPGNTRIYQDPFTKKLTFQDGTTIVTLEQIAGSGIGSPAHVDYPSPIGVTGNMSLAIQDGNLYSGATQVNFDVELCSPEGSGSNRDNFRWRDNLQNGGQAAATDWDITCTQIPASGGPYGPLTIGAPENTNYGFKIQFNSPVGSWQDGTVGDRWQIKTYPASSSSVVKTITAGNGISVASPNPDTRDISAKLDAASGAVAGTSSNSGLVVGVNGMSLLRGCNNNEILKWDSTATDWVCAAVSSLGGGTVTSVGSGTGLTGGPITGSGTLSLDYSATLAGNPTLAANTTVFGSTGVLFEGATADTNEGLLTVADPTADRTWTLPNATTTLMGTDTTDTLTNKTIGSTGLTFSGAATDITTGTNEHFAIMPNGTGNVGIGTTNPQAKLHVAGGGLAVDADQKLSLKGADATADSYMQFDSTNNRIRIYINGLEVARLKN